MRTHPIRASIIVAVAAIAASACGTGVTVEVTTEGPDGPQPQADLPIEFLPFDRDSVFDVLDAQASTPRPQMSDDLQAAAGRVQAIQTEWREKEAEWSQTRDQLRDLRERLDQLDARDPDYRGLYQEFGNLEGVERRLDRERKSAFDQFTSVQNEVSARVDSFNAVLASWEDEAYSGYYDIEVELLDGGEVVADTTDDMGLATVSLPSGNWWVFTRAPVAEGELYWNVRVPATDTLRLDPSNAELRTQF